MFAITSTFSWQNSVRLCPASFCTPRANLLVIPGNSWLPTFEFQSPMMKSTSFLVLVLEGLVSSTLASLALELGHRLGLPWYWMFALETNRNHPVIFEIAPKYCILVSFVDYDGYSISISFKRFFPTVVHIMIIWIKFSHSISFYFTDS